MLPITKKKKNVSFDWQRSCSLNGLFTFTQNARLKIFPVEEFVESNHDVLHAITHAQACEIAHYTKIKYEI